jgi:hypothetical protein
MFRFTIRDLLWLTVVVALGVGWFVDRRHLEAVATDCESRALWLTTALNRAGWRLEWDNGRGVMVELDDTQP